MSSPRASRFTKRSRLGVALTQRGRLFVALTVVLFVGAYAAGNREFLYVGGLLLALLVFAIVLVRGKRLRLAAVRTFSPPVVAVGTTTTVTITVANESSTRSTEAEWQDTLPFWPWFSEIGTLPPLSPTGRFAKHNSVTTLRYVLRPTQRGVVSVGPMDVTHNDPFGLVRGESALAGVQSLVVTPAVVDLPDAGLAFAVGDGSARLVQRSASGNDDDLMTREYRRGDALRRVHWRASARHGELMVRQEEQRSRPEARIVVDTRRSGYDDVTLKPVRGQTATLESETFEWVVRMTASIGVHLHRSGFVVSVVESGPAQIAPFGEANQWAAQDESFLASLATVAVLDEKSPLLAAQADNGAGPVFAIVGDPDAETLEWLLRQRRPQQNAIAFVPRWAKHAAEALANAGWTCIVTRTTDDPAAAWAAVAADGGRS